MSKLKIILKRTALNIAYFLMGFFKVLPANYIVFESKPAYTDNTYAVYDYIKRNNLLKEYRLVWHDSEKTKTVMGKILFIYYLTRSRAIVFCNTVFKKRRKNQLTIFLCHGSKSKKTRGKYEAPKDLDYILVQADVFKDAVKYEYNLYEQTRMLTLGYPRNDDLLLTNDFDREMIFNKQFKKLVIWYPTFRQHNNKRTRVSSIGLPIIHDDISAAQLNECAKNREVLIVLKPHFSQDVSYIKDNNLSNIMIIDDDFLKNKNIRSYQLLSLSDALITDYSSVYYDYLLTDRPIGLVWEDYDEYKQKQGFALDPDIVYSGGEKIYNVHDFCEFITRIAIGEDLLKVERNKIKDLTNVYQDANSAQRVCEFIVSKIEN